MPLAKAGRTTYTSLWNTLQLADALQEPISIEPQCVLLTGAGAPGLDPMIARQTLSTTYTTPITHQVQENWWRPWTEPQHVNDLDQNWCTEYKWDPQPRSSVHTAGTQRHRRPAPRSRHHAAGPLSDRCASTWPGIALWRPRHTFVNLALGSRAFLPVLWQLSIRNTPFYAHHDSKHNSSPGLHSAFYRVSVLNPHGKWNLRQHSRLPVSCLGSPVCV